MRLIVNINVIRNGLVEGVNMEKFYIVTENSSLNGAYWRYKNNVKEVNEYVKKFMEQEGIKANEYYVDAEKIYIVPTEDDIINFDSRLNKELENGLRQFKLNSLVAKRWVDFVYCNDIEILRKPFVAAYFNAYGRSKSRLFNIGDTVYCSYENEFDFNNPNGFKEIKASEFYSAIENEN